MGWPLWSRSGLPVYARSASACSPVAAAGDVVLIEFRDRPAPCDVAYLVEALLAHGVRVEVLDGPVVVDATQEVVANMLAIVTSFAVCLCGELRCPGASPPWDAVVGLVAGGACRAQGLAPREAHRASLPVIRGLRVPEADLHPGRVGTSGGCPGLSGKSGSGRHHCAFRPLVSPMPP